jgi:hypothetical protein
MTLFVDLDLRLIVATPGYSPPLEELRVRMGDKPVAVLQFVRDGVIVDPGAISPAVVVKTWGQFDQDPPLVLQDTFAKSGTGASTAFTAVLDFDTVPIASALGDLASLATALEVDWTGEGETLSTEALLCTIQNSVYRRGDAAGPGVAGNSGVDATITTEAQLAAIITSNLTVPKVKVWVLAADKTLQVWVLQAGTDANIAGSVRRPDDYNGSTNAKVWYKVG